MWRKDRRKHGEGSQLTHLRYGGGEGEGGGAAAEPPPPRPPGEWILGPTQGSPIQSNRAHVALGSGNQWGFGPVQLEVSDRTIPGKEGFLSYNIGLGCSLQFTSEGGTTWQRLGLAEGSDWYTQL